MSAMLAIISAVLLTWTTLAIVRYFPPDRAVRFWAALAAVNLHLTLAHQLASIPHALNPIGFTLTQAVLLLFTLWITPRLARRLGAARGPIPRPGLALLAWPGWRGGWSGVVNAALVAVVLVIIGFSLTEQMSRPVTGFDERMYNCSRILHWHQHGHIWPWITNNDAQVDFPIGSEVFFSWPLLFIKIEWPARLVYWMGYPVAVLGVYLLARAMACGRAVALGAAAIFASTPTILTASGINQKQDIWTAAMLLGVTHWILRQWRTGDRLSAGMSGMYLVLAVNVKITTIVAAPFLLLAALAPNGGWQRVRNRVLIMTVAGVTTLAISGLGFTFTRNFLEYRHPFGPDVAAKVLSPDWSLRQVYTHAVRTPLFLIELPVIPDERFRKWFVDLGNEVLYRLDAHRHLPGERRRAWPGYFEFQAVPYAFRYSLGGIIWLVVLIWGCLAAMKWAIKRSRLIPRSGDRFTRPAPVLPDPAIVVLLSAAQFAALVFLVRWMGGGPDRYWVAPYAPGLAAAAVSIDGWIRRRRWTALVWAAVLGLTVYPAVKTTWNRLQRERATPLTAAATDEPFTEVITNLWPGSRVLLVCNRNARDYGLFLPRQGFSGFVYPWGRIKYSRERLERMVKDHAITHAVFEREDRVGFHWYPGVRVLEIVDYFRSHPAFTEVPLQAPGQRLFVRKQP